LVGETQTEFRGENKEKVELEKPNPYLDEKIKRGFGWRNPTVSR